jgi:malate synthase
VLYHPRPVAGTMRPMSAYLDFLPAPLLARLDAAAEPIDEIPGLRVQVGLREAFPRIETIEALSLVCEVTRAVRPRLAEVLKQRTIDRAFLDARVAACAAEARAAGIPWGSNEHPTPFGDRDGAGRILLGPLDEELPLIPADIPDFLRGEQVTLFGPPDTPKMAINAMNALHRRRPDEPALVAELVDASGQVPRWGADDEDSKTPLMRTFLLACDNLMRCFDRTLRFVDERSGKVYELAADRLSHPIKRIPGLALPDGAHLLDGAPLPLHVFDLVQHVWHNRHRPEALVFYVPKLENEEEAAYLRDVIDACESGVMARDSAYRVGTIKIFLVFENPRAIFRIRAMAAALGPHFVGGSLGWHDYLASTARLFRNEPGYRIPVKADPDIVIRHIKESHVLLVNSLAPLGAISIGGMYGILFEEGNAASYRVCMVGYVRDVVTQLRRGLTGFWVAHPDFVRIGIALVEAFRRRQRDPEDGSLRALVAALVPDEPERTLLLDFVFGDDVPGLDVGDPRYLRAVLAADLEMSPVIANDDPEEVRYNVFQALQYLADWLGGNGCVALPATLRDAAGEPVFVRVMDDLATTERSRWELWAEVHHGRVSRADFERILDEEVAFLKGGPDSSTAGVARRVQIPWEGEAARWYPIAVSLLHQLVVTDEPPEFVTELAMAFTFDPVRDAADPWEAAKELCPGRFV